MSETPVPRHEKRIIWKWEFMKRALERGMFDGCGFEEGKKITEAAIKTAGIVVSDPEHGGEVCIFPVNLLSKTKLVSVPFVEEPNSLIVKTIFWSQQPHIDKYTEGINTNVFISREQNKRQVK